MTGQSDTVLGGKALDKYRKMKNGNESGQSDKSVEADRETWPPPTINRYSPRPKTN